MSEDWVIRHPEPRDAAEIARVHNTGWREAYGRLIGERFYDDRALARRTANWARGLVRSDLVARTYVAELDGCVVGFAHRGPARDADAPVAAELSTIYILSEVYGLGIGQALIDAVLGADPAMLWVAKENPRARRFYERNGFEPDGVEKIDTDCDNLVEIRMVRH